MMYVGVKESEGWEAKYRETRGALESLELTCGEYQVNFDLMAEKFAEQNGTIKIKQEKEELAKNVTGSPNLINEDEVAHLKKELEEQKVLQEEMETSFYAELHILRAKIRDEEGNLAAEEVARLKKEKEQLKREVEVEKRSLESLTSEREALFKELEVLRGEKEDIVEETGEQERRERELEVVLSRLKKEKEGLETDMRHLKEELAHKEREWEAERARNEEEKEVVERLAEEISGLEHVLYEKESELESWKAKTVALEEQLQVAYNGGDNELLHAKRATFIVLT